MTYLKVLWNHTFEDEPVELLSEIDANREETRKVERYRNGALAFAGPSGASGTTRLSDSRIPTLQQIAANPEFSPVEIDQATFERAWRSAQLATAA